MEGLNKSILDLSAHANRKVRFSNDLPSLENGGTSLRRGSSALLQSPLLLRALYRSFGHLGFQLEVLAVAQASNADLFTGPGLGDGVEGGTHVGHGRAVDLQDHVARLQSGAVSRTWSREVAIR